MKKIGTALVRGERATTTVEYAVIVAIVSAVLMVAIMPLAAELHRAYGGLNELAQAPGGGGRIGGTMPRTAAQAVQGSQAPLRTPGGATSLAIIAALLGVLYLSGRQHRSNSAESAEESRLPRMLAERFVGKRQQILKLLAGDARILLESRIEARHLMTTKVCSVAPSDAAQDAARLMRDKRVRHLMVVLPDGTLVGIISDRDMHAVRGHLAADIMTPNPIKVTPSTLIGPAVSILLERHISCLPVVEGEKLVGVLTTTDLLMAFQCTMQVLQQLIGELHVAENRGQRISEVRGKPRPAGA